MLVTKLVRTGAAALGIILATGLAQAADLYNGYGYKDQPAYILTPAWAGFYAGAHLGGAWSTIDAAENIVFLGATPGLIIADRTLNGSGFFGGVQAGYNFQSGNFVYGAEFDFGGMGSGANGSFRGPEGRVIRVDGSAGWYGDLTGRAGFSTGNALIYAKGGFA
ncbi:MAG: hypothetical protein HY765_06570, partial [Rhodomicrobium sp.]|nr:hypothetical protein [Rhodomicrobium sp.]